VNHLAIVRIVSGIGLGFAALFAFALGVALLATELEEALVFAICGVVTGGLGGTVLLLTDRPSRKTKAQDGLAVAIVFWLLAPVFCAFPFMSYAEGVGGLAALYESVSSLTTTGHSLVDPVANPLPASLLFWRALLHFIGAVATIVIAASVLSGLNLGGPGVHRNRFFTEPETSFFDSVPRVIRLCIGLLLSIVIILMGAMLAIGVSPRDALAAAVSVVSTGMVDPLSYSVGPSHGALHSLILWVGLVVGTLGLVAIDGAGQGKARAVPGDPETLAWIGTLLLVTFLAFLAGLPLLEALGWGTSSLSTSGIALSDPQQFSRLPIVLLLFPVLIGGSALSTAGGFKLARLIVLAKRVGLEFVQLGYRGSVRNFTFRGRKQSERTIMGVWVYLVGYIVACTIGTLLLSITGLAFDDAIRAGVGSLSNAGHILAGMNADLTLSAQICAMLGMVLGRLEVIALLPALNPNFWRR